MPNWEFQTGTNQFSGYDVNSTKGCESHKVGERTGRFLEVYFIVL